MKYVTCFNAVFSLTVKQWHKYLQTVVTFGEADLGAFGKELKIVIDCDVTDMDIEEAKYRLEHD